jgi:hypothetical protein
MSETMSNEEFRHYLQNDVNVLKGIKCETEDISTGDTDGKINSVKEALQNDLQHLLDEIIEDLSPEGTPDPSAIMNSALKGLSKIEAKRFLLQNLLEAIKGGNVNVTEILQRYKDLGLTTIDLNPTQNPNRNEEVVADGAKTKGFGKVILGLLKKAAKIALTVIEIIKNSVLKVFGSVGVKPIIGLTGAFPSISFQLEVENLTASLFFDAILKSI